MRAAVLHDAKGAPSAEEFPDPPLEAGEVHAKMLAAGLHQLVKVHARNAHYSSHGQYPMVPGVDGVVELPDGTRGYTGWLRAPYGTFAETVAIRPERIARLPDGLAPETAAAIVNPASSAWLALRVRAHMQNGERVLVIGATGASGQLAIQNARAMGAGRVVAAGRNVHVLERLGADAVLRVDAADFREQLERELTEHGVDIVLDYLWGPPAEATLHALLAARGKTGRVRYVNIGQSAGGKIELSPHVLRSTKLEMLGSGIGSVSPAEMAAEVPALLEAAAAGKLTIAVDAVPLANVDEAWQRASEAGRRIVVTPGQPSVA